MYTTSVKKIVVYIYPVIETAILQPVINPPHTYNALPDLVKKPIRSILRSYPLLRWYYTDNSYLRTRGWVRSEQTGAPVDQDGEPIPWYSYPAVDLIDSKIQDAFRVFEFGSGHSSLWYSDRVSEIVAVEDSEHWAAEMQASAASNLTVVHEDDLENYPTVVIDYAPFDIIVIDGQVRQDCISPAIEALTDHGVIFLDDFERWDDDQWSELRDAGFRALPLTGPKAQRLTASCTAILYRDSNCLEI